MAGIIEKLKARPQDLIAGKGSTHDQIVEAEKALGVTFAEDYKKCLLEFGTIAFDGHELTGTSANPRLNVVKATERQRGYNPAISSKWYVIEEANIDGITIWQESNGAVYGCASNSAPVKLANNLSGYLGL